MTNKERYANLLTRLACMKDSTFGVTKAHNVFTCYEVNSDRCNECIFAISNGRCDSARLEWLREEYIEPYCLTREEKTLLDMLDSRWVAMARNSDSNLCLYDLQDAYRLEKVGGVWDLNNGMDCYYGLLSYVIGDSYFQMVKWEDDSPWLISDLKKLKVKED